MPNFDKNIHAVELSIEQLLKLLGGTPDQRERFWETAKGITTPREERLTNGALKAVHSELTAVHENLAAVNQAAREAAR
jgi:hypothetical protein